MRTNAKFGTPTGTVDLIDHGTVINTLTLSPATSKNAHIAVSEATATMPGGAGEADYSAAHQPLTPFTLTAGGNGAITGFSEAVVGMQVGQTVAVYIPPALGYGSTGTQDGAIPPNANLVFLITLDSIS